MIGIGNLWPKDLGNCVMTNCQWLKSSLETSEKISQQKATIMLEYKRAKI